MTERMYVYIIDREIAAQWLYEREAIDLEPLNWAALVNGVKQYYRDAIDALLRVASQPRISHAPSKNYD